MKKFLALFLFVPLFCHASGYALYEMNAAANGMAHAYICRVDDASAVWYNPAALTRVEGTSLYASTTWINTEGDHTGLSNLTTNQVGGNFFPTNIYIAHQFSDAMVFGVGFYQPFGLSTEWPENSTLSFVSQKAQLRTYYVTPSVGYRLSPNLSIGGGIDFVYGDVKLERNISLAPAAPFIFGNKVDAHGTDFGFNLGVLVETNRNFDFAFTYKHKVDVDMTGDTVFTDVPGLVRPLFPDGGASITLPMPSQFMFGVSTSYEKFTFEENLIWTKWDAFDAIRLNFDNNTPALRDQITLRNYKNSWSFRIGADYALNDQWTLRAGFYTDKSPVPLQAVDPILPDARRRGITFGTGYKSGDWKADVSLLLLSFQDRTSPVNNFITPPGNLIAAGKYTNGANLLAFGFGYLF